MNGTCPACATAIRRPPPHLPFSLCPGCRVVVDWTSPRPSLAGADRIPQVVDLAIAVGRRWAGTTRVAVGALQFDDRSTAVLVDGDPWIDRLEYLPGDSLPQAWWRIRGEDRPKPLSDGARYGPFPYAFRRTRRRRVLRADGAFPDRPEEGAEEQVTEYHGWGGALVRVAAPGRDDWYFAARVTEARLRLQRPLVPDEIAVRLELPEPAASRVRALRRFAWATVAVACVELAVQFALVLAAQQVPLLDDHGTAKGGAGWTSAPFEVAGRPVRLAIEHRADVRGAVGGTVALAAENGTGARTAERALGCIPGYGRRGSPRCDVTTRVDFPDVGPGRYRVSVVPEPGAPAMRVSVRVVRDPPHWLAHVRFAAWIALLLAATAFAKSVVAWRSVGAGPARVGTATVALLCFGLATVPFVAVPMDEPELPLILFSLAVEFIAAGHALVAFAAPARRRDG